MKPEMYMSMLETAEVVAERYKIGRERARPAERARRLYHCRCRDRPGMDAQTLPRPTGRFLHQAKRDRGRDLACRSPGPKRAWSFNVELRPFKENWERSRITKEM